MGDKKSIIVLGSTGSVGKQALDVIKSEGQKVIALSAKKDYITLEKQAREFHPKYCILDDEDSAKELKIRLQDTNIKVFSGIKSLLNIINDNNFDIAINSITGAAGLLPTLTVIKKGTKLALANKESLVMAGQYIMNEAKKSGCEILPVDSEHCAIFQCLRGRDNNDISRIILTASGGPFYGKNAEELKSITVEQALAHPTWKMGNRITIDSATLMNKGFEVIEAAHLFGVSKDKINVLVHRESIIHSMIEYFDNSVIAQMSVPDMRLCVQYAVNFPQRKNAVIDRLDLSKIGSISFGDPDLNAFPLLKYAFDCLDVGGCMPAVLNASDEIAVDAFLNKKIGFSNIAEIVYKTLDHFNNKTISFNDIESIIDCDRNARIFASNLI